MDRTHTITSADTNGQTSAPAPPEWPGTISLIGQPAPSLSPPSTGDPPDGAATAPARRWRRRVAIGLGTLAVAGLVTAGVLTDLGVRHSLSSSEQNLAATRDKLKTSETALAAAQKSNAGLISDNLSLKGTISDQQQQMDSQSQQQQRLTDCLGSINTFFQDIFGSASNAAMDRDYSGARATCAVAGIILP